MGAGLFWGLLLILIGLGIVIRVVFNVNIPVVKFVIAFFFIFIGIKLLVGNFHFLNHRSDEDTTIFSESRIDGIDKEFKEHNIIFGSSTIDLRDVDLSSGSKEINVNTIFGSCLIKLSEQTPVKIKADAVFGSARLPNGETAAFGSGNYESENFNRDTNYLYIKGDVVFGGIEIRTY